MDKVQIKLIKDALENLDILNDWENEFISGIAGRDSDYELSERQNAALNKISDKVNRFR